MLSVDDLAFDVGSHHGLVAVALARRCARVVAVEPNPHNVAILQKNIDLNHLQNVQVYRAAVGDSAGEVELLLDSLDGGVAAKDQEGLATTTVPLVRLDDLAAEHGFPALIKIDVEGFEHQALRGASEILARRPKIAIEIHTEWIHRYGSSVGEVLNLLTLDQYDAWVMPHGSPVVLPWKGEDFSTYPPPKFNLFLMPRNASSKSQGGANPFRKDGESSSARD
jgi:FkbM family methyltransferase